MSQCLLARFSHKAVVRKKANKLHITPKNKRDKAWVQNSALSYSMKWGNAKIVIQVKYCTMLLNEHILIAQDPQGNKLHSNSKHATITYWPWRVLFIQIEIKQQRGGKSFPGLMYPHEVNRSHWKNITSPIAEIMNIISLIGMLTYSLRGHIAGRSPVKHTQKKDKQRLPSANY